MTQSATARPTHFGLVLLALAMGGFSIGTSEFASMSLLPFIAGTFGIDEPTAGHMISAYALGVVIGAPIIAVLAANLPRRFLLVVLMGVYAVGNALSAVAPDPGWMIVFRFLSGLPHGAYFGVAMLLAASLAGPARRGQAVAFVITGLTVATIIGVPLATAIGQYVGWRWGFALVTILASVTALLITLYAPDVKADEGASPLRELSALARPQVWLTLGVGAIGFGGMFCVYTYLASTMLEVTHVAKAMVAPAFAVFGIGMTLGTFVCAWAADRALMPSTALVLIWSACVLAIYPFVTTDLTLLMVVIFLIGAGGGLSTLLQTRLMDVAGDAQTLAAALNHSAFNTANALGPFLGGLAISAGYGFSSTGFVGAALALAGLAIFLVSWSLARREAAGSAVPASCAATGV